VEWGFYFEDWFYGIGVFLSCFLVLFFCFALALGVFFSSEFWCLHSCRPFRLTFFPQCTSYLMNVQTDLRRYLGTSGGPGSQKKTGLPAGKKDHTTGEFSIRF
jgi:hypothetical protein